MTDDTTTTTEAVSFDSFKEALPETTRGLLDKAGVNDFDSFGKDYDTLTGMIGKKGLMRPEDGASEEALADYNKQLGEYNGVPEDGAYSFEIPESWDESTGITQGLMDGLAKWASESNVGGDKFQGMVDTLGDTVAKLTAKGAEAFGTKQALAEEWGSEAESNEKVIEAFKDTVSSDIDSLLELPAFKKFALEMAAKSGDDVMDTGGTKTFSKEGLQDELDELTRESIKERNAGNHKVVESLDRRRQSILEKIS